MPASSNVTRGYGSFVRVGVGTTPTWTKLVGVEEYDMPDQTPDDLDVTHLESPNDTEETIRGMKKVGAWSVRIQYAPGEATDTVLTTLATSGETFLLEFNPSGGTVRTFSAYVKSWRAVGITPKDKMMAELSCAVQAEVIA